MRALYVDSGMLARSFPATLNVRTKLALCVLSSLSAIVLSAPEALGVLVALSAAYALSTRNLRGILIGYLLVGAMLGMSVLFIVLLSLIWPVLSEVEMKTLVAPFLRIMLMLNVVFGLALTSRIQSVLTALKSLRLPGFIYIPAAVMIRFIPTFASDFKQIRQALKIRGYPVHPWALIRHPLRSVRVLFVPLVFRALRSADDLAMAAELKAVGGSGGFTRMRQESFGGRDWAVLGVCVAAVLGAVLLQLPHGFGSGMH
ncbi:MAG: energy-coupling factor transporter transmembrane protein EcfT [Desulfovibrio sp.]|jgi:energy-coupling factor transport system permease protein